MLWIILIVLVLILVAIENAISAINSVGINIVELENKIENLSDRNSWDND